MLLLVLTGINMLVFELTAGRTIHRWDQAPSAPRAGKAVAALSLAMWIGIIFMGRMIGFTTTRAAVVAPRRPASISTTFSKGLRMGTGGAQAFLRFRSDGGLSQPA